MARKELLVVFVTKKHTWDSFWKMIYGNHRVFFDTNSRR
jgi:hypothetical protein